MALCNPAFGGDLRLREAFVLDRLDDFRPVHSLKYGTGYKRRQGPSNIYLLNHSGMDTFAERLRAARRAAKLSQVQLAKKTGLSQTTISNIESGRNDGSREILQLAKALKVNAEWLLNGVGPREGQPEDEPMIARFALVYEQVSDEGRAFLANAVAVAAVAYPKK